MSRGLVLVIAAAAALAGCHPGADGGAASNPGAPDGTATSKAAPQQGGGRDMEAASGHPQGAAGPGTGLHGGLGATDRSTAMGASPAASAAGVSGSTNRTTGGSVGNR